MATRGPATRGAARLRMPGLPPTPTPGGRGPSWGRATGGQGSARPPSPAVRQPHLVSESGACPQPLGLAFTERPGVTRKVPGPETSARGPGTVMLTRLRGAGGGALTATQATCLLKCRVSAERPAGLERKEQRLEVARFASSPGRVAPIHSSGPQLRPPACSGPHRCSFS